MPAKTDPKEAAVAAEKPSAAPGKGAPAPEKSSEKSPAAAESSAASGSKMGLFAAAGAVVLAPALSLAVAQFVMLPRLQKALAAPDATPAADASPASGADADKKGGKATPPVYEFTNVVVNLAGTMGTRYLKTSFMVTGSDSSLATLFETNKARLTDVTLNVLSSLTLADLEEPGSKNVLREKLVGAYNEALGRKVADQVYFSDFVVQ
jgi:flagellar FliL protein